MKPGRFPAAAKPTCFCWGVKVRGVHAPKKPPGFRYRSNSTGRESSSLSPGCESARLSRENETALVSTLVKFDMPRKFVAFQGGLGRRAVLLLHAFSPPFHAFFTRRTLGFVFIMIRHVTSCTDHPRPRAVASRITAPHMHAARWAHATRSREYHSISTTAARDNYGRAANTASTTPIASSAARCTTAATASTCRRCATCRYHCPRRRSFRLDGLHLLVL